MARNERALSKEGPLSRLVNRTTTHESVRETLRRAILTGRLPAGFRLVQAEIAEQLGVSTTPVREALRDLATEGLVNVDSYRGAVVHEPTLDEVKEVYELRAVLEPLAIRCTVGQLSEQHVQEAEHLIDAMDQEADAADWVELNRKFHAVLLQPCSAKRLPEILRGLRDAASAYVALSLKVGPERMKAANSDHRELLMAFRRDDGERAVDLMLQHLAETVQAIEQLHAPDSGTLPRQG